MYHNVEARAPFLDPRLIAISKNLPVEKKITPQESKSLLRSIAKKLVPDYKSEPFKKGFAVPFNQWFGEPGYQRDQFSSEYFAKWRQCYDGAANFQRSLAEFQADRL